jgi:16S rRNA (guanine527-N7)-methyltransferase
MTAARLQAVLEDAQRYGFVGGRPIPAVIAHARAFVAALHDVQGDVLDLGSGGGVPGLVIAHDRPELQVTLLDRRVKRSDFLVRAVGRLGWSDRVTVAARDAGGFAIDHPRRFAAVVARGFGPPAVTLDAAILLIRPGGVIVISEPPSGGDRWGDLPAVRSGAVVRELGHRRVARFLAME